MVPESVNAGNSKKSTGSCRAVFLYLLRSCGYYSCRRCYSRTVQQVYAVLRSFSR